MSLFDLFSCTVARFCVLLRSEKRFKEHKNIDIMKNLDWGSLSFGYMKTDYNVRCYYRDGKWGEIEVCSDEYLNLHMAATCLHYGQEAFEGLKAYRCPDGKVRIFRVDENAKRLQSTCRGILMPEVSTELFTEMVKKVVRLNQEWIPTYESGATLYIRPLLIGTSAQVGVHPAKEYCFLIFVTPVGPYFKGGFSSNPYVIVRDYDRSAPLGTGKYKVGGNYAASLFANNLAHEKGYACEFYLDAKEKKYIDECGAANFFGIKNNAVPFLRRNSRPSRRLVLVVQQPSSVLFRTSTTSTPASATHLATSPAHSLRNCSIPFVVSSMAKSRTSTAGQLLLSNKTNHSLRRDKLTADFSDLKVQRNLR